MRSLLDFLVRHSYVFLFLLLEILSLVLLFGFNDRQKEAFMTSANSFSGTLLEWSSFRQPVCGSAEGVVIGRYSSGTRSGQHHTQG